MKRSRINPISKTRRKRSGKPGKLGIVRLYGADLQELRGAVYDRAMGMCEMKLPGCEKYAGWISGEMHHDRHRSLGGSDSLENCAWACKSCHRNHHCPKPIDADRILEGKANQ